MLENSTFEREGERKKKKKSTRSSGLKRVSDRTFVPVVLKQTSPFSLFKLELCIYAIAGLTCLRLTEV